MRGFDRWATYAIVFCLVVCPSALEAQSLPSPTRESKSGGSNWNDESSQILSLENAWNQAERRHDVSALSLLLADIFEYTDSDGSFMSRGQWLAMIKNGSDQYEQLGNSGMVVHVYGAVAIVTGIYTEKGRVKGKMVMRSGRFTDTWIKQNGDWRCVASQSTLISP